MTEWLNEKSFEHSCRYGTVFKAARCDFRGGVTITEAPLDREMLIKDVAEVIGYHACVIHPQLNGFQGYDCLNFIFL